MTGGSQLRAEPIGADEFRRFGELIQAPDGPGRGDAAEALEFDSDRAVVLSTTHAVATTPPIRVEYLERHPHSSQTFLPLDVSRWLVIVATSLGRFDARAFLVGPGVGVTIRRGVWHHGLTVLDGPGRFAVLMARDGATDDEFVDVTPFEVVV